MIQKIFAVQHMPQRLPKNSMETKKKVRSKDEEESSFAELLKRESDKRII